MQDKKNNSEPSESRQDFPIVGIGASAGGLEAFKEFLKAIPEDSGMAYVLVQHLAPNHESMLSNILSRTTKIPVNEITDDIHLAPNHIYVIPENKILTATDGVLRLTQRSTLRAKNLSIDIFFTTLAEVHLNLARGVLLSGRGNDGTTGLKAIRDHGGFTFAQNPDLAGYAEMPQNAINAGVVDFVLAVQDIPAKLLEFLPQTLDSLTVNGNDKNNEESVFEKILLLLRQHSGVDFTYYKQTTIRRRIARRMAISKIFNLKEYYQFLKGNKIASESLFNDLLIPVTSFFRDPEIYTIIKKIVFPILGKTRLDANSIRVWVAGCSTGEEAYTLAIALHEFLAENANGIEIQIFASDISELAIAKARIGFYNNPQLLNVPESILSKYFTKKNNGYQVNKQLRDSCVFAVHNFLKDPPFAKMDLITCRNVLIYMDTFLQKKALTTFHYALREEGFLWLGKTETIRPAQELFMSYAKPEKIYTRKQVTGRYVHLAMGNKESTKSMNFKVSKPEIPKSDFRKSAESLLLSKYTPASVIINQHMDIVHLQGVMAPFLELSQGKPTYNILKMARQGLVYELRNGIHKSKESMGLIVKHSIPLKDNGTIIYVSIEVQPLPDTAELHFLILFYKTVIHEKELLISGLSADEIYNDQNLKRIKQLEMELAQTHADVNAITDEQEASNEELQSANEELLSGSEELQSLNEELETSKEELQSSNEELIIINQELLNKQDQINISRNYTEAIVATLREPIVVLDTKLRIKNINRAFAKKYNIAKEVAEGKLIYEIQNHLFDNEHMRSMLEQVLIQKNQLDDYQIQVNLQPYGESIMLLNARQVTNEESKEQLILLAIEDITERRIIERRLQALSDGFETKVKERTADLEKSNIELEASVKELHHANTQLQQFAYIASHDLQEPLRKILMFTSRLKDQQHNMPEEAVTVLEKISKSSDRMKTLIQDLLEFSYLNNHNQVFVKTDLNLILKNILTDFELLIEQRKVVITNDILPVLNVIPLQMNQLFYNLISNALKFYNQNGIPTIDISNYKLTQQQTAAFPELDPSFVHYEIIIKDNGIGFDQQYERRIFTIFQRLHSKDAYIGNGIGLAISRKITENHKGYIFAKAEKNVGAAFHVILPTTTRYY